MVHTRISILARPRAAADVDWLFFSEVSLTFPHHFFPSISFPEFTYIVNSIPLFPHVIPPHTDEFFAFASSMQHQDS